MDFVVTTLSWAGWIWTAIFFAGALLAALLGHRRRNLAASEDSQAQANARI